MLLQAKGRAGLGCCAFPKLFLVLGQPFNLSVLITSLICCLNFVFVALCRQCWKKTKF